jgi:hypothetical protein
MKTKKYFSVALLTLFFLSSCTSNDKESINATTAITENEVLIDAKIDAAIDDVTDIAEDQYSVQQILTSKSSQTYKSILPLCATIKSSLVDGTWTRIIDFGTDGCALANGNVLKGKIIISFSNNFSLLTQTITYRFEGFLHNGKLLEGTKTIVRTLKITELSSIIHPVSYLSIDLKVTFADGRKYTKTGMRTREMIEGFQTKLNWEDNVFVIKGEGVTTNPNGEKITALIKTPLRFNMACSLPFPVKGSILITKNANAALIDFGNTECDNKATITVKGISKEIKLEK